MAWSILIEIYVLLGGKPSENDKRLLHWITRTVRLVLSKIGTFRVNESSVIKTGSCVLIAVLLVQSICWCIDGLRQPLLLYGVSYGTISSNNARDPSTSVHEPLRGSPHALGRECMPVDLHVKQTFY